MKPGRFVLLLLISSLYAGCSLPAAVQTHPPGPTAGASLPGDETASREPAASADLILTNADILTMDDARPSAQAIAMSGEVILAVGTNEEVLIHRDEHTNIVDLEGRAVVPGFIDSHQHRIANRRNIGIQDPQEVIQPAIEQGWTTLNELYVDEAILGELLLLDQTGNLRLRVNAYLTVMDNSPEGRLIGEWYSAYRPGQVVSPRVRIAGLKVFTDFDNASILLWDQADLDRYLAERHREGWQLAVKTVSTRSLDMILKAFESVAATHPQSVRARARLEHILFINPDQLDRIRDLGLIPSIQTNMPGELVGDESIDRLIAGEPAGSYAPWRALVEAGIPIANGSAFPSYYVDEPAGAPFGSPVHLMYQAATRVGNLGQQPPAHLLDQVISPADALRGLTIGAAYAAFEEDYKGSLTPGKLADLAVLSENPLEAPISRLNNIRVLMTLIGGKVEWCAPGEDGLCAPDQAPQSTDAFLGEWSGTDAADGSAMSLSITGGNGGYSVLFVDEKATICGLDADGRPLFAIEILAEGTAQGDVLRTTTTSLNCLSSPPQVLDRVFQIDFTYRESDDTLVDTIDGTVWSRR